MYKGFRVCYMGGNQIGNKINAKTPPNSAKDISCYFPHFPHQVEAMIDLREKLKQEY